MPPRNWFSQVQQRGVSGRRSDTPMANTPVNRYETAKNTTKCRKWTKRASYWRQRWKSNPNAPKSVLRHKKRKAVVARRKRDWHCGEGSYKGKYMWSMKPAGTHKPKARGFRF